MHVGIHVPQLGRLADPAAIREAAVAAEVAGYRSLWVLDRLLAPVEARTPYPARAGGVLPDEQRTVLDPIGVLTLAASVTTRIRVGTSVLVAPWYSPPVLARSLTTLDHISGGRLDVGLGVGWSLDEHQAAGVPQRHLGARLDETLDVLEAVWGPDPVRHTGARVHIAASCMGPKPVQVGGPPVLLAAFTPTGLDRVARRAAGWNPSGLPVAAIGPMWRAVRDLAAGHGRDPDRLRLVVRANIDLSEQPAGPDRLSFAGSLDQVASDLVATAEAGADEVILGCFGDPHDVDTMLGSYAALVAAADLTLEA